MIPLATGLSRTTRLINQEFFEGAANEDAIAAGLAASTVRLIADEANTSSRAGQVALITTVQLVARMGIQIELAAPEIELIAEIPPLPPRSTLQAALIDLGEDLIPGVSIQAQQQHADLTFCFGDTPCSQSDAVHVTASELGCRITRDQAQSARIDADLPIGALAAAAAAAAIALDTARPNIERAASMARTRRARPSPGPPVELDLTRIFPEIDASLHSPSNIDLISGGAITNAFLATQLWLPHNPTSLRVFDDDSIEPHNLNRCLQFRGHDASQKRAKVDALAQSSTQALRVIGKPERFDKTNRDQILPFAEHVVVGVDDIPARWLIQEAQPANLYIGATTNNEAILTTHHPGQPCAACAHPDPLDLPDGQFIPTISFVSFWAGLLQSCALLAATALPLPACRTTIYPFGLGEQCWGNTTELPNGARCPLQCSASKSA